MGTIKYERGLKMEKKKGLDLDFIRNRRKELGITLLDMAEACGLKNAGNYYKYEVGIYKFDAEMLPVLAKKLKCGMGKFFYK